MMTYASPTNNGYGYPMDSSPTASSPYTPVSSHPSPYVFSDDYSYFKDKPKRGCAQHPLQILWKQICSQNVCVVALLTITLAWSLHARSQRAWLLREMQVQSMQEAINVWHTLHSTHAEVATELDYTYSLADKLEERDAAWKHQVEILQNATQREARRAVLDKFGAGPHQVEFTVATPYYTAGSKEENKHIGKFIVQLAPLKLMPHSSHLFLEQVSHGLWDGSTFSVNQAHVLQVGPKNRQMFRDYELEKLAFPEYSPHFPHRKWTLGYAGRPGGPSWYINKLDNQEDHGPFGQEHHALHEFADPCFARVVYGFDALKVVFDSPFPTQIVTVKVVDWKQFDVDVQATEWHKLHEEWESESEDYASGESSEDYPYEQVHAVNANGIVEPSNTASGSPVSGKVESLDAYYTMQRSGKKP